MPEFSSENQPEKAVRFSADYQPENAERFPKVYRPEHDAIARAMAIEGCTNVVIAENGLGIHVRTFYEWCDESRENYKPSFAEALKEGRSEARKLVESSLFKLAIGGTMRSVNRKGEEVETDIPPNASAAQFWLKNRARADWGDKTEVEHSGSIDVTKLNDDAIRKAVAEGLAALDGRDGPQGPDSSDERQ